MLTKNRNKKNLKFLTIFNKHQKYSKLIPRKKITTVHLTTSM